MFFNTTNFGVALYGAIVSDIALGVLQFEQELGANFVKVFGVPMMSVLSDPSTAPMYNRIIISTREFANSYIRTLRFLGWTHTNIITDAVADFIDIAKLTA